jgi:uncharacterized protein (TIGR03435 family)
VRVRVALRVPVVVLAFTCGLLAQGGPTFDVVSVKANRAGITAPARAGVQPGERVSFENVTVRTVIQVAYQPIAEIAGGPAWIGEAGSPSGDRFDIEARTDHAATAEELRVMLRRLLAERFDLKVHTETQERPAYALVLARRDGRLGPNLHVAEKDCATLRREVGYPTGRPCGLADGANNPALGRLHMRGFTLDQLAGPVAREVGRPVVDKTGMSGSFDWTLTWTPQRFLQGPFDRERFATVDPNGPSIFTALEEQLGLKLQADETSVDVIVIDHIERPNEN